MIQHRCSRCDQVLVPGEALPMCIGGRYRCEPMTARRVEVADTPCRCTYPTKRITIIPIPKTAAAEAGGVEPDEDDRVAVLRQWARELGRMPGRDAVKARFGVGSGTANLLREAAEKPPLRAVS